MFQPQDYNYMQQGSGQFMTTQQGGTYATYAQTSQQQAYATPGAQMMMSGGNTTKPKVDKPIKATEIKSYLHAWCTKRGEKPEYSYTSAGKPPKVRYQCQLRIPSIGQDMTQEATSKKSAQTNVAWAYIDWLITKGMVNPAELPPRPDMAATAQVTHPTGHDHTQSGMASENTRFGGWTTENARQRLNRFCVQQGLTCNIINQVGGTPQQKITTAELSLNISGNELKATAQSSNKKSANAHCSLEMIAKLIELGLIGTKADEQNNLKPPKRKVDDVGYQDEHGNWNPKNSVQRMTEFAAEMQNQEGFSNILVANKEGEIYKGRCHTFISGFEFLSEANGTTEEEALSQVAFENVSKLFKAGIILARKNERGAKRVKESGNEDRRSGHIRQTDHIMLPRWGSGRMTPWDDRHIKAKLVELEHSLEEKTALRDCSIFVEGLLKRASDDLEEKYNKSKQEHYVDIPENRILVGVMKIGDYAKGLLLKDEMTIEMCVSFRDKPTVENLQEVANLIKKHANSVEEEMILSGTDLVDIEAVPSEAAIRVTKNLNGHQITVNINFTSQRFNADLDGGEDVVEDPTGMLPRADCIRNLIESRRTNFFTSTAPRLLNCICISRIVKDIVRRDSDWDCMKGWTMELTVVKSLGTIGMPETAGDCLRRFMSTIAGGTFLPGGAGLTSVVEKDKKDLIVDWTPQQRESITFKAQTSLRLLSFRKIHQVLGIEMIPSPKRHSWTAGGPPTQKGEPNVKTETNEQEQPTEDKLTPKE